MRRAVLVCLALSILVFGACSKFEETETGRFEYGIKLLKKGDKAGALDQFRIIDSLYPQSPYGAYGRTIVNEKENFLLESVQGLINLTGKHEDFLPGYRSLAELYLRLGWFDPAMETAARCRQMNMDKTATADLIIKILMAKGELKKAESLLDSLKSLSVSSPGLSLSEARLRINRGDFSQALKIARDIRRQESGGKDLVVELGRIYADLGWVDSAAALYRKTAEQNRDDYFAQAEMAEALIEISYLGDAQKILKRLTKDSLDVYRVHDVKIRLLEKKGEPFEALKLGREMIPLFADEISAVVRYAGLCVKAGDATNAQRFIENAGSYAVRDSLDDRIQDEIAYYQLKSYMGENNWLMADAVMQRNQEQMPRDFNTLYLFADIDYAANKRTEAEIIVQEISALTGDNPFHHAALGELYNRYDSVRVAEIYFDKALEIDKYNISAILGKMSLAAKQSRYQEALEFLSRQGEYAGFNSRIFPEKALLLKKSGRYDLLAAYMDTVITRGPGAIPRYRLALRIDIEMNGGKRAEELLEKMLKANPDDSDANLTAGEYYLARADYDKARDYVERVQKESPENSRATLFMAQIEEGSGQIIRASELYHKIITEDPLNGPAYGALARITLEQNGDMRDIMNFGRQAIKYDPNPEHLVTLGRAFMKQSRWKAAARHFELALEKAPDKAEYAYYYGQALIKEGEVVKAREYLTQALNKGLSGAMKTEAERALQKL